MNNEDNENHFNMKSELWNLHSTSFFHPKIATEDKDITMEMDTSSEKIHSPFSSDLDFELKPTSHYDCKVCSYITFKKYNYDKHLLTIKHLNRVSSQLMMESSQDKEKYQKMKCQQCKKQYYSRSGLWGHIKTCKSSIKTVGKLSDMIDNNVLMELVKNNKEISKMLAQNIPLISHKSIHGSNNHINSHNKQFNLNFFLNETCKNAMNMSEFVDSLEISSQELEDMGKLGYIKGISNILIRGLTEMDEVDRPMHCTDKKREIMYFKENGVWEKDTDTKEKMKKLVRAISHKNFKHIAQWKLENPTSDDKHSAKHLEYIKILSEVMTSISPDNDEMNDIHKIQKILCVETYVGKIRKGTQSYQPHSHDETDDMLPNRFINVSSSLL